MTTDNRRPRGIKLIELMAIVAVVGVALGVILPALARSRGNARRIECINNMRQLGLGIQGYINAKNVYPNACTIGEDPANFGPEPIGPADSWIAKNMLVPGVGPGGKTAPFVCTPGGGPGGADTGPLRSWVVDLLPFLDYGPTPYDRSRSSFSTVANAPLRPNSGGISVSNALISSTFIKTLTCPEDDTINPDRGDLSYACNLGFSLWWGANATGSKPAASGWTATPGGGVIGNYALDWGPANNKRTGLMTIRTAEGTYPWDVPPHTTSSITDGSSFTICLSENVRGGASGPNPLTGGKISTNWATGHPCFVGFMASDAICNTGPGPGRCGGPGGPLATTSSAAGGLRADGPGWARANLAGTYEEINYGSRNIGKEGGSPFINSRHPGGFVVAMCDGSVKFVFETIDGTVFAKLITPQGQALPVDYRQLPLSDTDF